MAERLRVGLALLPTRRWADGSREWQALEAAGFDHGWTYDHLLWDPVPDHPWFGSVPTLAAASAVTTTPELGALVFSPNVRHPVSLAQHLTTLADISAGRLVAAVGAGGTGSDSRVLGQRALTPAERVDRLAEFLTTLRALLDHGRADFRGDWFDAVDARCVAATRADIRVPLAVAANGPRTLALAATHGDAWVTDGGMPGNAGSRQAFRDGVASLSGAFRRACARQQRDPASLRRIALIGARPERPFAEPGALTEACAAYAAMGFTDVVVHAPRAGSPFDEDAEAFRAVVAADLAEARSLTPAR